VLAHHISLITVQAGVGLELFDRRPEQARAALAAVKDAGNTALGELREALDILRDPEADLPRAPAPQISRSEDLGALLTSARSAGLRVRTRYERGGLAGPEQAVSGELPILVDQACYRILQESLTNAVRHAGPGTLVDVDVLVEAAPDRLVLSVRDDGCGASAGLPTGGKGISGMSERAAALGGTLRAGPRPGGGFAVRATLPLAHPADGLRPRPHVLGTAGSPGLDDERSTTT
jgi:signal transduction histidine kinase